MFKCRDFGVYFSCFRREVGGQINFDGGGNIGFEEWYGCGQVGRKRGRFDEENCINKDRNNYVVLM